MWTPTSQASEPVRSRDRTGGFTLIEVVLALAIVSLLAALALPAVRPGGGMALLQIRATEIASLLRSDRNAALNTGRTVVTRLDRRALQILAGGSTHTVAFPAGVPLSVFPEGLQTIRFLRDGRSSGGRIELGGRNGGVAVTINPQTAAVLVEAY